MRAFKFLAAGGIGLYSGFAWPLPRSGAPGAWVEVEGELVPCARGLHVCRVADLPYWLDDELWHVEVEGELVPEDRGLLARRARLVARVEGWDAAAAAALARACVQRVLEQADAALTARGHEPAPHDDDVLRLRASLTRLAAQEQDDYAAHVLAYAADTAEYAANALAGNAPWASCTAYLDALLAGYVECGEIDAARTAPAFVAERAWQAGWLRNRLGLVDGS